MSKYSIGEHSFDRKNLYLPCAINARLEEMSAEEQAGVYRAAYWADNITEGEWPVVLSHEDAKRYHRSRLKKKAAGWLVAFARIVALRPEFAADIAAAAEEMYREQVGDSSFVLQTLRNATRKLAERTDGETVRSWVR
jgi:hypothetical protein